MVMPRPGGLLPTGGEQQDVDEELRKQIQKWLESQAAGQNYNTLLNAYKQQFPAGDEAYLKEIAGAKGISPQTPSPLPGVEGKPGLGPTWEAEVSEKAYAGAPWGATAEQEAAAEQERTKKEQERIAQEQLQETQRLQTTPPQQFEGQLPGAPGEPAQQPSGQLNAHTTTSEGTYLQGIRDLSAKLGTEVNFPGADISQMSGQERRLYRDQLRETYRNLLHLDQQRQSGKIPEGWTVEVTEPENPGGVPWEFFNDLPPEQQQQFLPQTKTAEEI
ncbi:MAG: hypothetical protein MUO99_01915, partial [Dehalococcoidales bacterium]|nr:hypothetical protein [Dehalococcoidales bacterium]